MLWIAPDLWVPCLEEAIGLLTRRRRRNGAIHSSVDRNLNMIRCGPKIPADFVSHVCHHAVESSNDIHLYGT